MGSRLIALFGAGSAAREALAALSSAGLQATCVFDNDRTRWGATFEGLEVRAPVREAFDDIGVVWIASMYATEIGRQLALLGIAARVVTRLGDVLGDLDRPAGTAGLSVPDPRPAATVEIVLADRGWILERLGREIEKRVPYARVVHAATGEARLTYYMNYSARRQPVAGLEMAFVAHLEEDVPAAAAKAVAIAREMRVVIAMATRYADQLREQGAGDVRVICPGVDLERFRPVIRVGVIGRTYHTGRKGEALVREVLDEPGIEWQFTGDGWPMPGTAVAEADMPAFYRSLDYVLVPARYEGGPMSVLEALASGVEVIAPDIGFVEDYPHLPYRKNDAGDLRRVLRALVATREARHAAVASRTWEAWADAHHRVFTEVLAEVPVTQPTPAQLAAAVQPSATDNRQPAIGNGQAATGNRQPAGNRVSLGAPDGDGRLKVLLCLHDPERVAPVGGPSIRVRRMQAALATVGVDADLAEAELPDTTGYDLAHVFNVWEPESARRQLQHVRDQGCPVVFSPILLDLFEGLWSQRALLPLFRGRRPPEVIERDLDRLLATPMDVRRALGAGLSTSWERWPATVRDLVGLADHLLVLSRREIALLDEFRALSRPFSLVHNGVDLAWPATDRGAAFRAHVGVGDYVLCVGRVEPRKNQLLLAWALRGTGLDLVLLGETPKPEYEALVRSVPDVRVHVVPRLAHDDARLASAYAGARVFALPSWSEGMPLSALEAAAAGTPLVLSDRSGERESLGPCARYCDPADWRDIRRAVIEAWGDASRVTRAIETRAWIARALTWEHAARETARAYAAVLEARGRDGRGFTPPPRRALEIGSGLTPLPDHEHLDARADLPGVDHVADIRSPLPFPDATFDHVSSRNCLEHVPWRQVGAVLDEWARILKPHGTLDLWTPDFEYLCRQYLAGRSDLHLDPALQKDAARTLGGYDSSAWALVKMFGGQDYPENFHGAVVDEPILARLLAAAGFEAVARQEPFWGLRMSARRAPGDVTALPPEPCDPSGAWVPTLRWDGPFFNTSGYAAHGRYVTRALVEDGIAVQLTSRDDVAAVKAEMLAAGAIDAGLWRRVLRRGGRRDVHVTCYTATDWEGASVFGRRRAEARGYRAYVGLTHFECDRLPAGWVEACADVDELWVATRFVRDLFLDGGVPPDKVHVLPTGIDAARFAPDRVAPLPVPGRRRFVFLSTFDWTLRKGWDVLVAAWGQTFGADEDVSLVLRTASRRQDEDPDKGITEVLARDGRARADVAPIIVLRQALSDEQMARLYRAADVFILPTRGEGLGLPFMEAMAAGVPVIATRWGGHLDVVDDETGWLVDITGLVPVDPAQTARSPFYTSSQRWAEPSVAHTAALLRHAFAHPEEVSQKGRAAREAITARWSPAVTARWVRERLAVLAPDPDDLLRRGRAAEAAGHSALALDLYLAAARARRAWVLPVYNRASLLMKRGKRAHARRLFEAVVAGDDASLHSGAFYHLGQLAMEEGDAAAASRHLAACLALNPLHRAAQAGLAFLEARAAEDEGRLDQAAQAYERAYALRPAWDEARHRHALLIERAGDDERALTLFAEVARSASSADRRADAHVHIAGMLLSRGDHEQASGQVDSALIESPSNDVALALRARLDGRD